MHYHRAITTAQLTLKSVIMKKSELTNGMLIVLRDGDKALIVGDVFSSPVLWLKGTWGDLKDYDENLNYVATIGKRILEDPHFGDIMEVYGQNENARFFEETGRKLLWRREE